MPTNTAQPADAPAPAGPGRTAPAEGGRATVVVVGMGPVGMFAALALAGHGVDVTVLEAGAGLSADSRASTFHPPTLELLDDLGVCAELHTRGLIAPNFQYRDRAGRVLADLDLSLLAEDTRFPYRLQSEQNNLTEIIAARLAPLPHVTLRFGAPVQRVERGTDHARIFLEGDGREPSWRADWVIAADGASSQVRKGLGIAFEGITLPERFLIASTTHELSDDIPGLAPVSYVSDPEDWGVLLRTPRHWRVLMPVADESTDAQATDPEVVEARLQKISPRSGRYPLDHTSIYAVHQRVAASFAAGRVLLAGDAAHANNPLGGMGMNSGIHDARAAADVILAALDGADPELCAAAYDTARRHAAVTQVQAQTKQNYAEMTESDAEARHARTVRLGEVAADPRRARRTLLESSMITPLAAARELLRAALRTARARTPAPAGRRLAELIAAGPPLTVPGCHDAVSARLLTEAGFPAAFLSGAGVSATVLGVPDLGFAGLEEMAAQIGRITAATDVPLIADADGGYGGPLHTARTVRTYERLGAAAAQVEDQRLPKRTGAMDGKELIPVPEMTAKVRAAVAARAELLVIARTDAYGVEGFDAALERAVAYSRAGADLVFVEGLLDPALLERVHRATGRPLVISRSESAGPAAGPLPGQEALGAAGVAVVLHPVTGLLAASGAVRGAYASIAAADPAGRAGPAAPAAQLRWPELTDLLGLPALLDAEHRCTTAAAPSVATAVSTPSPAVAAPSDRRIA